MAVLAVAWMCHTLVVSDVWQPLIAAVRLDPVYTGAALTSLGSAQPEGLAVAAPLGALLHALNSDVFTPPELARSGAFVSAVVVPGASLMGKAVASFGGDVVVLSLGLALMWWSARRTWLLLIGVLAQAEVVLGHVLRLQVDVHQLEASGVPLVLGVLFSSGGWWITDELAGLPEVWQRIVLDLAVVIATYATGLGVLAMGRFALRGIRHGLHHRQTSRQHGQQIPLLTISAAVAIATVASPLGVVMRSASNWQTASQSIAFDMPGDTEVSADVPAGPHVVSVARGPNGSWQYLVDGQPEVIRGVGYNPQYAALPVSERVRLYQRDFSAIRSIGANTIEGWFENQFDEVTLTVAAQNHLGVILPFDLNQDWDYADPAVQAGVLQLVSDWVLRYRDHPALRMWAPGNENLHRFLYRNWISQEQLPQARKRTQAFAAFLVRLVDRIHDLDPDHPVLYRDAEDVYLNWLRPSFETPPTLRPWLVYGANVYSIARLEQIIATWPAPWVGGPLVISEFAPAGRGPDERALGYREDWRRIRARPGMVLGGLAYTWAANGPEELDRVFGLVDANGVAFDSALAGLGAAFLNDANQ
jgi:hypothetical protein